MQKEQSVTLRIIRLLRTHMRTVWFLILLIILASAADIAVPFVTKRIIDTLVAFFEHGGAAPFSILVWSAGGILFFTIANRILKSTYNIHLFKLARVAQDELQHSTFAKYLSLHALFHHSASSGQIVGRIDRGTNALYIILNDIFGQNMLPPLVIFAGTFATLLFKNVWIALVVFVPLPIYLLVIRSLTNRIYIIEQKVNEEFETIARESYDVAGNVLTVKKFSREDDELASQKELRLQARETEYSAEKLWAIIENTQTLIATIGRIGVIVLAGILVLRNSVSIGDFVLYVTLQNMAYGPLAQLSVLFPRLRRNITRVERVFAVLDEPVMVTDKPNAFVLPPLEREIRFSHVSFRYAAGHSPALKDVDIVIPAMSTVALVGRSGSGKTTFANLVLRSFDPTKGAILIDGHDIRDITQESLHAQIAVVPQEVDLFSRTIAENISYGKPRATRKEIIAAAETALAHDFITQLEHGYDTLVGERGIKLSGGERQRVGIARAVLKNPRILILDEATSHLDTESERLIQRATESLMKNRTTIIIAHRLSTILKADTIFVFHAGALETQGPHELLLKKSPTYQRLHSLQFAGG